MAAFSVMTTRMTIIIATLWEVERIEFHGYEALLRRFERELYELWRTEDERDDK
jgi:hypothetical protein